MKIKKFQNFTYNNKNIFSCISDILNDTSKEIVVFVPLVCAEEKDENSTFFQKMVAGFATLDDQLYLQKHKAGQTNPVQLMKKNKNVAYLYQMFANKQYPKNKINFIHLVNCMLDLRSRYLGYKEKDIQMEIHLPKNFGCHPGSGRWSTMADLITDCWTGIPTVVYGEK